MLIAIFGTGRNGSTLISRLLDGIPGAYMHPLEVNFLAVMNDLATRGRVRTDTWRNATTDRLSALNRPLSTELLLQTYARQADEIKNEYVNQLCETITLGEEPSRTLQTQSSYTPQEFVPAFLRAMAGWTSPSEPIEHYIFKTGETPYIADYERLFPAMKFVHIFRDPIAVYSSQKRTIYNKSGPSWFLGRDNLETMLDRRWIPHAQVAVNRGQGSQHFVVRYEDMTENPTQTITSICEWLGLPAPKEPAKQTALGGRSLKVLPKNPSKQGLDTPVEVVRNLQKVFNYDEVLTPREKGFITTRTFDLGRRLGYFKDDRLPNRASLVAQWLPPDRWEFMNSRTPVRLIRSFFSLFYRRYYVLRRLLAN